MAGLVAGSASDDDLVIRKRLENAVETVVEHTTGTVVDQGLSHVIDSIKGQLDSSLCESLFGVAGDAVSEASAQVAFDTASDAGATALQHTLDAAHLLAEEFAAGAAKDAIADVSAAELTAGARRLAMQSCEVASLAASSSTASTPQRMSSALVEGAIDALGCAFDALEGSGAAQPTLLSNHARHNAPGMLQFSVASVEDMLVRSVGGGALSASSLPHPLHCGLRRTRDVFVATARAMDSVRQKVPAMRPFPATAHASLAMANDVVDVATSAALFTAAVETWNLGASVFNDLLRNRRVDPADIHARARHSSALVGGTLVGTGAGAALSLFSGAPDQLGTCTLLASFVGTLAASLWVKDAKYRSATQQQKPRRVPLRRSNSSIINKHHHQLTNTNRAKLPKHTSRASSPLPTPASAPHPQRAAGVALKRYPSKLLAHIHAGPFAKLLASHHHRRAPLLQRKPARSAAGTVAHHRAPYVHSATQPPARAAAKKPVWTAALQRHFSATRPQRMLRAQTMS